MNKIVTCQNKNKSKYCQGDFEITPDDFTFYEKIKVPPPTFCPTCRMLRRISARNQRSLYLRECSKCSQKVPSVFSPSSLYTVYCTECYFKDDWNAEDYFADYDFSKPFFVQFSELLKKVPQLHVAHTNNNGENIVFSNYVYRSSNVYLSYGVVRSENIYYSWGAENGNKMCIDSANFTDNENCYEIVSAQQNYDCTFLTRSHRCVDSHFLFDCVNCSNCFMSSNLRNKSYVFRNEQLTKEEYFTQLQALNKGNYTEHSKLEDEYDMLMRNAIHRYASIVNSYNSTGDFIFNSKNVKQGFSIDDCEDVRYCQINTNKIVNCLDFSMAGRAEESYEFSVAGRGNFHTLFCLDIGDTHEISYCDGVNHVKDLFGCIGLKNKEYCILNKQYTKEEYIVLKEKIIEHMNTMPFVDRLRRVYKYGEFFPIELSRFDYNQTNFFDLFPMKKKEAEKEGYTWYIEQKREYQPTIEFQELSDSIVDTPENISQHIFPCVHDQECNHICTGAFKITDTELLLYKKLLIPIPRMCPNCRYFKRKNRLLPWQLWTRTCMNSNSSEYGNNQCQNTFETSYSPDRPEKVYCEACYKREVL